MLNKIKTWLQKKSFSKHSPTIIPRKKHSISRKNINPHALKILYRLQKHGYSAYLVGGGVRDLLLDCIPKDFDLVTDAHPEQVRALFKNSLIIGRRFLLVHVRFGREIIEVATFRADNPDLAKINKDGMILRDNVYGTLEDDVARRDFTVNALYYSVEGFKLIDYFNGYQDLKDKKIRIIGDPAARYREDPLRMLRALRFAAKLGFILEENTGAQIHAHANLIKNVASARLFDEYIKLFLSGHSVAAYDLLQQYSLLDKLFAQTAKQLKITHDVTEDKFIRLALANTDARVLEAKTVNPGFLIAVLLWNVFNAKYKKLNNGHAFKIVLYCEAMDLVLSLQQTSLLIPKTFLFVAKEIWMLQARLNNRAGSRASRVFASPKFRAGLDFLQLRADAGDEQAIVLAAWWQKYMHSDEHTRFNMAQACQNKTGKKIKKLVEKDS